mmetsp:Transcript_7646/g.23629  ORF Transcript_7646/g.23629 Transcript_7646/m.23629 type:complete len:284 (+) Transcript_7646:66-917(+)
MKRSSSSSARPVVVFSLVGGGVVEEVVFGGGPDAAFVALGVGFDGVPARDGAVVLGAARAVDGGKAGAQELLREVAARQAQKPGAVGHARDGAAVAVAAQELEADVLAGDAFLDEGRRRVRERLAGATKLRSLRSVHCQQPDLQVRLLRGVPEPRSVSHAQRVAVHHFRHGAADRAVVPEQPRRNVVDARVWRHRVLQHRVPHGPHHHARVEHDHLLEDRPLRRVSLWRCCEGCRCCRRQRSMLLHSTRRNEATEGKKHHQHGHHRTPQLDGVFGARCGAGVF